VALAIAAVALIAVVFYYGVWTPNQDTYAPRPEAFELLADGREVMIAYCGSTADFVVTHSVREDDRTVVVGARFRRRPEEFQNGTVVKVTFALNAPLGSRTLQDDAGTAISSGRQYLCPG
jgi:hypothetical protein